jgi:mRNA-degrading endonuclease toxin of MazEF toxin-antitoxin module
MQRGEIWFAATPGGDRPVLVLTRDPVADRIGSVVVAALTRTRRGLVSELVLTASDDGVPSDCVVNLDNDRAIRFPPTCSRTVGVSDGPGLPDTPRRSRLLSSESAASRAVRQQRRPRSAADCPSRCRVKRKLAREVCQI